MAKIDFKKQNIPFTMVANGVLTDKGLSLKAKGLYAYLYSKPEGWDFSGDRIALESSDKRVSVFNCLKELEDRGYLFRTRMANGRMVYKIIYPPDPNAENQHKDITTHQKPLAEKAKVQKPHLGEISSISNKENPSNKEIQVIKTSKAVALRGNDWNIIDLFKPVNPLYEEFYKNTTERNALEYLASRIGLEKLRATLTHLPEIVNQPYAPKITKPSELKRDLGKLIVFYNQNKNKQSKYGGTKIY